MGSESTIQLLTQINGALKQIVQNTTPQSTQQKNEDIVRRLHKGDTSSVPQTPPKEDLGLGGVKISDLNVYLSNIPDTITKIGKLEKKDIQTFKNVMKIMSDILEDYAESTSKSKGAKNIETLITSIDKIADADLKNMFKSFVAIDNMQGTKSMDRVIKGMVSSLNRLSKVKTSDLNKLKKISESTKVMNSLTKGMGITVGSVIALAVTIDKVGASNVLKAVGTSVLIIGALTGLAIGVGMLGQRMHVAKDISKISLFILGMQGLVLTTLLVGKVAEESSKDILIGFAATSGVLAGYVVLMALTSAVGKESMLAAKDLGAIMGFAAGSNLLVLTTLLTGMVAHEAYPDILKGFGASAGVMLGYTGLTIAASKAAKLTKTSVADIAMLMGVALTANALTYVTMEMGEAVRGRYDDIMVGFANVSGVMVAYSALMTLTSRIVNVKKVSGSVRDMAMLGLVGVEAMLLVGGVVKLSDTVRDADTESVLLTFGMTSAMMLGIAGVGKLATSLSGTTRKGIIDLALIGLLAAGSLGIVKRMTDVAEAGLDVGWDNVFITLGAMSSVVAAFGVLAMGAGAVSAYLIPGSIALGLVELVAFGSTKVLQKIVETNKVVATLGDNPWNGILNTIGQLGVTVGAFATLSAAAGAASIVIIPGTVALGAVELIASKSCDVLKKITTTAHELPDTLDSDIKTITGGFKNMVGSFADMFGIRFGLQMAVILAQSPMLITIAEVMSVTSRIVAQVARIGGPDGKIRAAQISKDGTVSYGEYVDVVQTTTSISNSIKTFVTTISDTFKDIKMMDFLKASVGMAIIGKIIEPVSMFADTMLGFQTGPDGTIHSVRFAEDGTIINGPDVKIVDVANNIAGAISEFCNVLFSEENASTWENMIAGTSLRVTNTGFLGMKRNVEVVPGTAQQAMGVFAMVVEPISAFAQTLTMFGTEGDFLSIPIYDQSGKPIGSRPIDVRMVAEKIAGAVTVFAQTLVSHQDVWQELLFGLGESKVVDKTGGLFRKEQSHMENNMEKAMGIFSALVSPVVSFANMISQFDSDGTSLTVFDEDGKKRSVNIVAVATSIGGAIDTYLNTMISVFTRNSEGMNMISDYKDTVTTALDTFIQSISGITKVDPDALTGVTAGLNVFIDSLNSRKESIEGLGGLRESVAFIRSFANVMGDVSRIDTRGMDAVVGSVNRMTSMFSELLRDDLISTESIETFSNSFKNFTAIFTTIITEKDNESIRAFISSYSELGSLINGMFTIESNSGIQRTTDTLTGFLSIFSGLSSGNEVQGIQTFIISARDLSAAIDMLSNDTTGGIQGLTTLTTTFNEFTSIFTSLTTGTPSAGIEKMRNIVGAIREISELPTDTGNALIPFLTMMSNTGDTMIAVSTNMETSTESIMGSTAKLDARYETSLKTNAKYGNAVLTLKNNFQEFDKVLNDGNSARVRSIDSLTEALERMGKQASETLENISMVKDLFQALNGVDTSKADSLLNKIAEKLRIQISHNHTGQTIDRKDIEDAIRSVLSDIQLTGTYSSPDSKNDMPAVISMEVMA